MKDKVLKALKIERSAEAHWREPSPFFSLQIKVF
jgi:hypothetical protein